MRRLVLFAHFDPNARIRPYIEFHLKALQSIGDEIWFISNSPLPESEMAKVSSLVSRVLLRENIGYDFGMWKDAIQQVDLQAYDELLLTNSSIAGPFWELEPLFERMANEPCDFWGLTENQAPARHLQSYFLLFRSSVMKSNAFSEFWPSVLPYRSKGGTIFGYEIGLSVFLRDAGFHGAAAFPASMLVHRFIDNLRLGRKWRFGLRRWQNQTIYYPDLLIRAGMPYVKLELLEKNFCKLRLRPIRRLIRSVGYDLNLIK